MKEHLAKARELLEEKGWCQGTLRDEQGRLCVTGAIIVSSGGYPRLAYKMTDILSKKLGEDLTHWNDTFGRTKEEVIALLKEAEASAATRTGYLRG